MIRKRNKLVCNVGVNDSDYVTQQKLNGKLTACPFYLRWRSMIKRCYDPKCYIKNPTYIGCTVCEEWLTFSNFKKWMETQDWEGKQLDKDLLVEGNKVYSPETCAFVDKMTNTFITDCGAVRGEFPLGVMFYKSRLKFRAHCRNPFTKRLETLGYFSCPNEAHLAWRKRKHELALQLADMQTDERVAAALRVRYVRQEVK